MGGGGGAGAPPPKTKSWVSKIESYLSANGFALTFLGLYAVANVILFFFAATPERRLWPVGHYRRNLTPVARGAGNLVNFNAAFILLISARKLMSWLRNTPMNMVIPFDKAMPAFHMLVGRVFLAASLTHVAFHLPVYVVSKPWGPGYNGFTQLFITGSMLVALFGVLYGTSLRVNRSKRYELFWYSHAVCATLGFILLLIHGLHYGVYRTYRWVAGPMAVYIIDRLMRRAQQKEVRMSVSRDVGALKGDAMLCLRLPRTFTYEPGQYAEVKVPAISSIQWHPFTIASAPHEPELVFYIKKSGDWTGQLHKMFASTGATRVEVLVRGPYGSPAQHVGQFENVVLIGGGVGSTPFCGVVKSAHNWLTARPPSFRDAPPPSYASPHSPTAAAAAAAPDRRMHHSPSAATVQARARLSPRAPSASDFGGSSVADDLSSTGSRVPAGRDAEAAAALQPPGAPSSFTSEVLERRVAELDRLYSIADEEGNDRAFPPPSTLPGTSEGVTVPGMDDGDGVGGGALDDDDDEDDDDSSRLDDDEEADLASSADSIGRVLRQSAFINSTAGQQLIGLNFDADAEVVKARNGGGGGGRRTSILGAFFGGLTAGGDRRGTLPADVVRARTKRVATLQILHSVSVNLALLWAILARFTIVALAAIMRGFSPSTAGLAMFTRTGLVAADLALAAAATAPLVVSLACEMSILGVPVFFRQRGSLVDTLFLLPLLVAGLVLDALAMGGVGSGATWFAAVNLLVLWPLLLLAMLYRLTRVVGSRLALAQNVQASHSLRSLDFVWTAPKQADDGWLVEELLPCAGSGAVRLHRHITRATPEVEPWMLDYDEVPIKTTYQRPDWGALMAGITERSRSGTVVGVFFCGPHPMSKSIQEGIARATALSLARGYRRGAIGLDGSGEAEADVEAGDGTWKLARTAYQRSGKGRFADSYGSNVRFAFREENFL